MTKQDRRPAAEKLADLGPTRAARYAGQIAIYMNRHRRFTVEEMAYAFELFLDARMPRKGQAEERWCTPEEGDQYGQWAWRWTDQQAVMLAQRVIEATEVTRGADLRTAAAGALVVWVRRQETGRQWERT